jgi:hypothetical protein
MWSAIEENGNVFLGTACRMHFAGWRPSDYDLRVIWNECFVDQDQACSRIQLQFLAQDLSNL